MFGHIIHSHGLSNSKYMWTICGSILYFQSAIELCLIMMLYKWCLIYYYYYYYLVYYSVVPVSAAYVRVRVRGYVLTIV